MLDLLLYNAELRVESPYNTDIVELTGIDKRAIINMSKHTYPSSFRRLEILQSRTNRNHVPVVRCTVGLRNGKMDGVVA